MPASPSTAWRGALTALLPCCLVLPLASCIIPQDHTAPGSRGNITEKTAGGLQPGVTTKEEVLLKLGEPDRISADGWTMGYVWSKVKLIWFIAAEGGAAGGEVTRDGILQLTFDEKNRLLRADVRKQWGQSNSTEPSDRYQFPQMDPWTGELLRPSAEVKRLVIDLPSHPSRAASGTPPLHSITVSILAPLDQRTVFYTAQIGLRINNGLGTTMSNVFCSGSVPDCLREALMNEVRSMGNQVVDTHADLTVTPKLTRLWVKNIWTPYYCDIIAAIECDLVYESVGSPSQTVTKHYAGQKTERTYLSPYGSLLTKALSGSLDDLLAQVRRDEVWQSLPEHDATTNCDQSSH